MIHSLISIFSILIIIFTLNNMTVYVTPDHDTTLVNSDTHVIRQKTDYEKWEEETLAYAPDYYTIENDYDDDIDII